MIHCARCGRRLKHPTPTGYGRICATKRPQVPAIERDLFGYDVAAAASAAQERIALFVEERATLAHAAVRAAFRQARAGA